MVKNPFEKVFQRCKSEPLSEHPVLLVADIELTNYCNLACTMCPVGRGKKVIKNIYSVLYKKFDEQQIETHIDERNEIMRLKGFMDLFFYQELLGQLKDIGCTKIRFVRWGEPTLHPRFTEFLRLAKKNDFTVHFNTNGQLFDEELVNKILIYVDSVKFSFQGVNKDEYERIRKGAKWDTMLKWITFLADRRGQGKRPYIEVGTTVSQATVEECESFGRNFVDIADAVCFGNTKSIGSFARESIRNDTTTCPEFNKASINWDGTVSFCCGDYDNLMLIGDLKKQSLFDIWSGELAVKYRKMLIDKQHGSLPLCRNCLG